MEQFQVIISTSWHTDTVHDKFKENYCKSKYNYEQIHQLPFILVLKAENLFPFI